MRFNGFNLFNIFFSSIFSISILLTAFSNYCFANNIQLVIHSPVKSSQDKNVENIVVYLTPKQPLATQKINTQPLIINQKNKKFVPYVTVVQQGQHITFHNSDDITHHIYSVSGKNRFEFKIKGGKEKNSPILKYSGEVAMGCNIHDWMSGYTLVVNTPFYNKTNEQGLVEFNQIPSGQYQVTLWHPQLDLPNHQQSQVISVGKENKIPWHINLQKPLLAIPTQESQEDFDFLEGY